MFIQLFGVLCVCRTNLKLNFGILLEYTEKQLLGISGCPKMGRSTDYGSWQAVR